jgi:hypothetical protein
MKANSRINQAKRTATSALLLSCSAVVLAVSGCRTTPVAPPEPPSGGQTFVLDYDTFVSTVAPIMTARGCDTVACHGGGIRGTFQLSPDTDKDVGLDFGQASLQVNGVNPPMSPLLMKPLAESAGGSAHAGSPQTGFVDESDPDYQTILAWISAGEFQ